MQTTASRPRGGPWVPLAVSLVAVPTFVAFWIGGRPGLGLAWASVSLAFGLVLAAGGRSETIQLVRGDLDDERVLALEYRAMTITMLVLTVALGVLFLAEGVRGGPGIFYGALLLLAEGTHVAALAVLNRRG